MPVENLSERLAELFRCAGWRRSQRGNLYKCLKDGTVVTIFKRKDYTFTFCVYDSNFGSTRWSEHRWASEHDALEAALLEIEELECMDQQEE